MANYFKDLTHDIKITPSSPEQSEAIQRLALAAGYRWAGGADLRNTHAKHLYVYTKKKRITFSTGIPGSTHYRDHAAVDVTPAEILGYGDEPTVIEGMKFDDGKTQLDLLPFGALELVGQVLTIGAKKYAPDNWKHVLGARSRYLGAALRHLFSFAKGDKYDEETGLPHLAHAACCVLFLLAITEGTDGCEDK